MRRLLAAWLLAVAILVAVSLLELALRLSGAELIPLASDYLTAATRLAPACGAAAGLSCLLLGGLGLCWSRLGGLSAGALGALVAVDAGARVLLGEAWLGGLVEAKLSPTVLPGFVYFGLLPCLVTGLALGLGLGLGRLRRRRPPPQAVPAALALAGLCGVFLLGASSEGGSAGQAGPNLLLVTIDTWRYDHLSAHPEAVAPDLTPNLDALAARGLLFTEARAHAPITVPSHATMLSGRAPWEHGVVTNGGRLPDDLPWLPEQLSDAGWHTGAVVSGAVIRGDRGFSRGFDAFHDDLRSPPRVDDLVLLRLVLLFRGESSPRVFRAVASRALPRARAFLKSTPTGRPWFLWLHFYDVHLPHSIEEPEGPLSVETVLGSLPDPCLYRDHPAPAIGPVGMPVGTKGGPDEKLVRSRRCDAGEKLARRLLTYRAEVQHVDAALGELLGELEERGELDSTAIVVTADHGESLTEHGFRLAHQFSAYEPVLRVPLVVVPPGSTEGSEVSELAQHRDLAATASELLGLEDRTGGRSWLGASAPARVGSVVHAPFLPMLRPRGKGEADALPRPGAGQIIRVAVRDDSLGLVRTAGLPDELYDLRDDPSQVTDLVSTEGSPVPEGLGEVATAIQERLGRRSPEELEPEDQDLEALRALGYVE